MSRITVSIKAYILNLFPNLTGGRGARSTGETLRPLSNGLAVPSFWHRDEIQAAFAEANRIWTREADIEFTPVDISERTEVVPPDEHGMWVHFVNNLPPPGGRGIGVGFVNDLPSQEGGWGGGRIAVVAGEKARSGLAGFPGNLLAHELGHVLMGDPNHALANDVPSNLMYARRNPRLANAGMLNQRQIDISRTRAQNL
jgi:hypothetical protein